MSKLFAHKFLFVFIVFILSFGIRIYYISQKEGLHIDEMYSLIISLRNEYGFSRHFDENEIYSGKEIKEMALGDNASWKETLSDIWQLHKNNKDSPNTSLYYTCLRIWIKITGGQTGELQSIIIQGCSLNLLFFIVSFFFMYKLAKRIFTNQWMIILALCIAFFNTGSISNALYIRTYLLQETLFILMTYLFVCYYQQIEEKKKISSWTNMGRIAFAVCFVLSTGYFAAIYVALYAIVLLFKSHKKKQNVNLPFLFFSFLLAFIFAGALYCKYFDGFLSYRGIEALGKVKQHIFYNFAFSTYWLLKNINHFLLYTEVLLISFAILIYILFWQKEKIKSLFKKDKALLSAILVSFLWAWIVTYFAPYKFLRYIAPVFPTLSLCIPWIVSKLNNKKQIILLSIFSFVFLFTAFHPDRIENLYPGSAQKDFSQYPDIPVILEYNPGGFTHSYLNFIPYLSDKQQYEFAQSTEKMMEKLEKYTEVFVVIEKEIDKINIPDNYDVKNKFDCEYGLFTGYHITKKE
jgi:hypothetical protein